MGPLSGNKFVKLEPNLERARAEKKTAVVSFGGAWSNHLVALAHAAREAGLASIGLVRGESHYADNATLKDALAAGMQLRFISRATYQQRDDSAYLHALQSEYPQALLLPEGGSNLDAVRGCSGMLTTLSAEFLGSLDTVCVAVGTGATLTGICHSLQATQEARGYSVVRDAARQARINGWRQELLCSYERLEDASTASTTDRIGASPWGATLQLRDASAPGYAKLAPEHWDWVRWFSEKTSIWLDPLYPVKRVASVFADLEQGEFARGTRILLVHTGGWQGWRGIINRQCAGRGTGNPENAMLAAAALQDYVASTVPLMSPP